MPDIREVITTFSVKDSLSGPLKSLEGQSSSLVSSFSGMKTMVLGAVAALGVGGLVSRIIEVGAQAEQTSLVMGGMLTAFGYSGTLAQGMQMAAGVMEGIESAAAALPGEAQDYVNVFTAGFASIETHANNTLGLAPVQHALEEITHRSLPTAMDRMSAFSNTMTAIGSTFSIDSAQIGRDMNLMLAGRAGMASRTFSALLPYMSRVEGQANLTAISFNHMTDAQRTQLLVKGMQKLAPMLAEASNTWDAISGSLATTTQQTLRGATLPLFNAIKATTKSIGELLEAWKPRIVSIGASISLGLVAGFQRVRGIVAGLSHSPAFQQLAAMAMRGRDMVLRIIEGEGAARSAGAAVGLAAMGPQGVVLAGVASTLAANATMQKDLLGSTNVALTNLALTAPAAVGALGAFSTASGGFTAGLVVGLWNGVAIITDGLRQFVTPLLNVANDLWTTIGPGMTQLGTEVGGLVASITTMLRPALTLFGGVIQSVWATIGGPVRTAVDGFVAVLTFAVQQLSRFFRFTGGVMQTAANVFQEQVGSTHQRGVVGALTAAAQSATDAAAHAAAQAESRRPTTPAARAGHTTHNDFRHSRFDITQKFAEGFDPDRIAVGFVTDLERMSNARLTSGFSPLFGG